MTPSLPCPVADLTTTYAGAYAGRLLAEAGLPVLQVRTHAGAPLDRMLPPGPGGFTVPYLSGNAKKACVHVDASTSDGARFLERLVGASQVLLTDTDLALDRESPGVTCVIEPSVKWMNLRHELPSDDIIAQALSGAMAMTGRLGGHPTAIGFPIGDLAPAIYAAIGVLHGLVEGRQQRITIKSLDATVSLLSYLGCAFIAFGEDVGFIGSGHPHVVPYGAFSAKDGYIVIGAFTQPFWYKLCGVLDRADLAEDPRFRTFLDRRNHRDLVNNLINDILGTETVETWARRFDEADVPNAPILSMRQALEQDTVEVREMATDVGSLTLLNSPLIALGARRGAGSRPALNQDWQAVLETFGFGGDEVARLATRGVVRPVFA